MGLPSDIYPVLNLNDPALSPKTVPLGRPISADVPLCEPAKIRPILDRLWEVGIPHVTFVLATYGDQSALVEAVERGGDLGMITGVRGRGSDLDRGTRIADLAAAGLDHLDVYYFAEQDAVHDELAGGGDRQQALQALGEARNREVCAVAQVALVESTLTCVHKTLQSLGQLGVTNVHVFAIGGADDAAVAAGALAADQLPAAARLVEESAEQLGLRLLWYPSVRFDPAVPLGQQVCRGPRCGGDLAIRVEPDGSVIPARGPLRTAGNLLGDDWNTIENSDVYRDYRRRVEGDTHCAQCPGLAICAADCPRDPAGWADMATV